MTNNERGPAAEPERNRFRRRFSPSKARAGLLAGGGLVFGLYAAAALVGALLGAILGRYPVENAFIWFGLCLAAMFGAAMVFASFKLLEAAGQALRAA